MKHLAKLCILLATTGGLLVLMARLCGRRKRRKRTCYVSVYNYDV